VGGASGEGRVYNTEDGKLVATLKGDPVAIFAVAFHPDGQQIATGGFDGQVRVFNAVSGELVKAFVPVPLSPEMASSERKETLKPADVSVGGRFALSLPATVAEEEVTLTVTGMT
jgi:WD40 repeat protein